MGRTNQADHEDSHGPQCSEKMIPRFHALRFEGLSRSKSVAPEFKSMRCREREQVYRPTPLRLVHAFPTCAALAFRTHAVSRVDQRDHAAADAGGDGHSVF